MIHPPANVAEPECSYAKVKMLLLLKFVNLLIAFWGEEKVAPQNAPEERPSSQDLKWVEDYRGVKMTKLYMD